MKLMFLFLKEMLDRIGLPYEVDDDDVNYTFSEKEIEGFVKTRQDFLDGKTTARNWNEVKKGMSHQSF
jgi:hypothetical protein